MTDRKNCPIRHENGNCLMIGGFCTAVNDAICTGLHNAYNIGYAKGLTAQRWIPVTERLPEDGQTVLTCKNGICEVQTYEARRNGWVSGSYFWSMAFVTHWTPLPDAPKDGE